jgi:thiol-disulfide isomerase/thioredoxin
MTKKNLVAYIVIAVLFGAAGAYYGTHRQPAALPPASNVAPVVAAAPAAGAPATATTAAGDPVTALYGQTLPDAKGVSQALAQYKGKATLVNFWAPWCGPCVQEMPELSQLASGEQGKNLQVIGIGIDSPSNITEFTQKIKITYPVFVAGMAGTDLSRAFGNTAGGLPYTVLIGADGQVKKTYLGRLKFDQLRADLASL